MINLGDIKHFNYGKGVRFYIKDIQWGSVNSNGVAQDVIYLWVVLTDSKGGHWEGKVGLFKNFDQGSSFVSLIEGFAKAYPEEVTDAEAIDESNMKGKTGVCNATQGKKPYVNMNDFEFDGPAPIYTGDEDEI